MGHAFQQTLMDALTRYHRMRGYNTLWQPGTDHAGIATQIVVERQLEARGQVAPRPRPREVRRARVGVEGAVRRHDHAARCAASAPRSTGRASASRWTTACRAPCAEMFVRLYEEGLIYRGKRLVNWDPVLQTAVSDLEVDSEEEDGYALAPPLSARATAAATSSSRPRGPRRCSATPRSRCIRTTSATAHLIGKTRRAAADRPRDPGHRRRLRRPRVRHRRA